VIGFSFLLRLALPPYTIPSTVFGIIPGSFFGTAFAPENKLKTRGHSYTVKREEEEEFTV
jgi:hypothetical protein